MIHPASLTRQFKTELIQKTLKTQLTMHLLEDLFRDMQIRLRENRKPGYEEILKRLETVDNCLMEKYLDTPSTALQEALRETKEVRAKNRLELKLNSSLNIVKGIVKRIFNNMPKAEKRSLKQTAFRKAKIKKVLQLNIDLQGHLEKVCKDIVCAKDKEPKLKKNSRNAPLTKSLPNLHQIPIYDNISEEETESEEPEF